MRYGLIDKSDDSSEEENTSSGGGSQSSGEEQNMSNAQSEEISSVASEDVAGTSYSGSNESAISIAAAAEVRRLGPGIGIGLIIREQQTFTGNVVKEDPRIVSEVENASGILVGKDSQQVSDSEQQGKEKKQKLDEDCKTADDDILNKLLKKKDDEDDDTGSGNTGLVENLRRNDLPTKACNPEGE